MIRLLVGDNRTAENERLLHSTRAAWVEGGTQKAARLRNRQNRVADEAHAGTPWYRASLKLFIAFSISIIRSLLVLLRHRYDSPNP